MYLWPASFSKFYLSYWYVYVAVENDSDPGTYVKDKLDEALRSIVDEIDLRKQAEEEEGRGLENVTKEQKDKDKYKKIGKSDANKGGIKQKKKSLIQEEIDINEAYQLLLSEYHKRATFVAFTR